MLRADSSSTESAKSHDIKVGPGFVFEEEPSGGPLCVCGPDSRGSDSLLLPPMPLIFVRLQPGAVALPVSMSLCLCLGFLLAANGPQEISWQLAQLAERPLESSCDQKVEFH